MISLRNVFSDYALFQHSAPLCVGGKCDPLAPVKLTLSRSGKTVLTADAIGDENGVFSVPFTTPEAGLEEYEITVAAPDASVTIRHILFGELWFAGGQSNMEMCLNIQPEQNEVLARAASLPVRFYQNNAQLSDPDFAVDGKYPIEDQPEHRGFWVRPEETEKFLAGSGMANAACVDLAARLGIPVGYLNTNLGATSIESWIPQSELARVPLLEKTIRDTGRWITPENANTFGNQNYLQISVMYHLLIPAIQGVKVKGLWWYQGESDAGNPDATAFYEEALKLFRDLYRRLFAAEDDFPMICTLLYPWIYGPDAGRMYAVNRAMVNMAKKQAGEFFAVPIYDLSPIWAADYNNHPIHPAHKVAVGRRFARVTEAVSYGGDGDVTCADVASFAEGDDGFRVTFDRGGLHASGEPSLFSVADERGIYLPAKAKIVADDTLLLTCADIPHPTRAMYQYTEAEVCGNLFCGDLPVAPFCTYPEPYRVLPHRPWLDLRQDSAWGFDVVEADDSGMIYVDSYPHPTWQPARGCSLCHDNYFAASGVGLRIFGENDELSAYVDARPLMDLDLDSFAALTVDTFVTGDVHAFLDVTREKNRFDRRTVSIPGTATDIGHGRKRFTFPMQPGEKKIVRFALRFHVDQPVKTILMENLHPVLPEA